MVNKVGTLMTEDYKELFNIFQPQQNLSLSLFNSEGFFWLTTATSIAFAAEELAKFQEKFPRLFTDTIQPRGSEPFIDMFKESVKTGSTSKEVQKEAQQATLDNLRLLADFSRKCPTFTPEAGVVMGKTFATYWLIFKLIEVEWQQILNLEETNETYMLLDTVIMDHEELEYLEKHCLQGKTLSEDDKVYLRSHWNRVKTFWGNLNQDLNLLAGGFIRFSPPIKR